jgi:hypothetical protein
MCDMGRLVGCVGRNKESPNPSPLEPFYIALRDAAWLTILSQQHVPRPVSSSTPRCPSRPRGGRFKVEELGRSGLAGAVAVGPGA